MTSRPVNPVLLRYVEPQWQLLAVNSSANASQLQTEGCVDGWTFDQSEFTATTVSEVTTANLHCLLISMNVN